MSLVEQKINFSIAFREQHVQRDVTRFSTGKRGQFDLTVFNLLRLFLARQSGKLCLVSHGCYGFSVLQSELGRIGKTLDKVDDREVWFVDSEEVFKKTEPEKPSDLKRICDEQLSEEMPDCPTTEEQNICLVKVVLKNLDKFLSNLKCEVVSAPEQEEVITESEPEASESDDESTFYGAHKTQVYLDLEATGLRQSKITELCMVAVTIDSLQASEIGSVPRIVDKLVLLVDPDKTIEDHASSITKLNNQIIEESFKPKFNAQTSEIIAAFLERQASPICLVAHNGMDFDFPLLKKHIRASNSNQAIFSEIRCSDSLLGMRKLRGRVRQSCKLEDVFRRSFPRTPSTNQHQAEDDVIKLMKIVRLNYLLGSWINNNYRKFSIF
ncbi:three-prime repair exonuclease 1-like [Ciona intestinalis]